MEENEMGKNEKTEKSQETTSTNQENNIKSNVEKEESKADTEKKEEPKFKKAEPKVKKSKHIVAKTILILIGIVVVLYFIFVMRNYYIINQIKAKASAYKDVNNFTYHTKADDFESTATQKENIARLDCSRFGKNDEETIIWFDKNTGEGLIVLPNQKKATRVRFSDVILNAPFEYTNIAMEIETDAKILYTWIYTDKFDGKECYVLCYNKNNKEWIDKETGLLLKKETDTIGTSEFTNIEVNTVDEVYKPDLTGYEIVNEEND